MGVQVDKLFRNRNLIGDTSVDEQAALFDWMRKQLPAAMLKRRGDLADYGRSVVHLTIAYIVVPDRARGDLLTIEEMLHDMCQAQHAEEPLLVRHGDALPLALYFRPAEHCSGFQAGPGKVHDASMDGC